jgi:hypothetical protein
LAYLARTCGKRVDSPLVWKLPCFLHGGAAVLLDAGKANSLMRSIKDWVTPVTGPRSGVVGTGTADGTGTTLGTGTGELGTGIDVGTGGTVETDVGAARPQWRLS